MSKMAIHIIVAIILSVCFPLAFGQTWDQSVELMSDLLDGYDRRHRPVLNQSHPINVNVTFDLVAIQDFDELEEKFSVVGILYLTWTDEKLLWNPYLYGGLISVPFNSKEVWYPILILANPYDKITELGNNWITVRVYANGFAVYSPGDVFKATCSVDVSYYPFDTQHCELMFVPWGFSPQEIHLISTRTDVMQTFYSENGEWTIDGTSAFSEDIGSIDAAKFRISIKRKPLFLLINVILPIVFMMFINILVFVLPPESGERVSYAVTVLLAIAVFLTLVGDNLPKTSKPMSILCYFLMLTLVTSTLMTVTAIFNLRLYHKDPNIPVPAWCATIARIIKCKHPISKCKVYNKDKNSVDTLTDVQTIEKMRKRKDSMIKWIPENVINADDEVITWKDVSSAVDRICILVFLIAVVTITGVYLSILVNNKTPST